MLEGVPRAPYGDRLIDLLKVEPSMTERRKQVESVLRKDECVGNKFGFKNFIQVN